jgi:hypothetical protein
MLILREQR